MIAVLILAAVLIFPLPAVCAYGPIRDRVHDRRVARRREVERVVAPYRPIRIAQWTGRGWAEVIPRRCVVTIAERVAAGAAFLDEREPGWWERESIDLGKLDLSSTCRCVLGQLASDLEDDGAWSNIVRHFGLRREEFGEESPGTDVAHGFNAGGDQMNTDYDDLTAEWKRVITARREASREA